MKRKKNIFVGFFLKKCLNNLNVRDTITILKINISKLNENRNLI